MAETIPVRHEEAFDTEAVLRYLREHIPQVPNDTLQVRQFSAGHSNLTYLLSIGDWQGVLRRPPLGPVAPKAHDMEREFRLLQVVHAHVPKAPEPYAFCGDEAVIGAPFYVMQRLFGVVIDEVWPPSYPNDSGARRQVSEAFIKMLAEIHQVTPLDAGIGQLGHPDGYMQRQVEGWMKRHELAGTDSAMAGVNQVGKWLRNNLPKHSSTTLIHNDFKLNNILFDPSDPSCITGVVDWEMSTVGDPLSDLAIALAYWAEREDSPQLRERLSPVTVEDGFATRLELANLYADLTGRNVDDMVFYMTFAYFKYAGIMQQIYHRWQRGQTSDPRFEALGEMARGTIEIALEMTTKKSI